ncbi:YbfB/YjiJ family MFS transporter [Polynucleobacter kasalickyi]|uniref:Predicted arabinose efflux permease, MFS family n=1 Tax=Polynucleobacter kasalickyi TaxID=1938817 RepID=A0A1W1YAG1_9BURK|nr:YbfB/YjiJ family MFS transporter [Polynucleobacter kasalickyi]SMC32738.1 Predicted arabinose efflux permease, MFS family [Polynucleobacter kasalickyi]
MKSFPEKHPLLIALALALGAAITLGISRFAYALFLPLMRIDLNWSYLTAGNMNTGNAMGYFIGAMSSAWAFSKVGLRRPFLVMLMISIVTMFLTGFVESAFVIFIFRLLLGFCSGYIFIAGGVLATQLSSQHSHQSGLILGIYYGGIGGGVLLSSILVNPFDHWAQSVGYDHPWQIAWIGMAGVSLVLFALLLKPVLLMSEMSETKVLSKERIDPKNNFWIGSGYFLYGIGHVGYMTFVIAMLREMGFNGNLINLFYGLLGLSMMLSSRLWAKMLERSKGGEAMGLVNLILTIACFIPTIMAFLDKTSVDRAEPNYLSLIFILSSATLFGSSFVVAVSSTTAFVKHNYPKNQWSIGIRFFTILFATGQIIGPFLIGFIADHLGGLPIGLLVSTMILLAASLLAYRQKSFVTKKSVG